VECPLRECEVKRDLSSVSSPHTSTFSPLIFQFPLSLSPSNSSLWFLKYVLLETSRVGAINWGVSDAWKNFREAQICRSARLRFRPKQIFLVVVVVETAVIYWGRHFYVFLCRYFSLHQM
ncbi:unnamed protein product, partial [Linum tenue]